jgi:N-acyl-D-aspartate/D-glutamate deacylase
MSIKGISIAATFAVVISILALLSSCTRPVVDYLITGATVFDGSLNEPRMLDVGIKGDRIVLITKPGKSRAEAAVTIDASGLYLAPGFIDPHTHALSDLNSNNDRSLQAWLWQGVTTVFEGNDGSGPLPVGSQLDEWTERGIGINAALFVGHGTVRGRVIGSKDTLAGPAEIEAMKELVKQAMEEGAFGLSSGLFYSPGSFANTAEVIELARVAAQYGGIYDTHMRDESSYGIGLIGSVKETIEIGEKAGLPVHISHIKALGRDVWGKSEEVIKLVEEAQSRGLKVTANQYPYPASKTGLKAAVVPRWAEDGGNSAMIKRFDDPSLKEKLDAEIAENIWKRGGANTIIFTAHGRDSLKGLSLGEAAARLGLDEVSAVKHILRGSAGIGIVSFNMQEEDIRNFMQQPWVMTGSDGGAGHPRKYGTFPRKIREYTLEKGYITLPEAIHRSSGLTAETMQVKERGMVKEGFYADLIVFNLNELRDMATFDEPALHAKGMVWVFVNGVPAIEDGSYSGELAGRALRLTD